MAGEEPRSVDRQSGSTSDDLSEAITQLHAAEVVTRRQLLEHIATFDEQEKWREDFCRSMADWLVARLSISYRTAAEWVRVARALRGLPAIDEVVSEGRLSWDQLAPLTEVATETTDQVLSRAAPGWSAAETKDLARRAKAPKVADANEAHRARRLTWWHDAHLVHLRGALPTEAGDAGDRRCSPRSPRPPRRTPRPTATSPSRRESRTPWSSSPRPKPVSWPTPTVPSSSSTPTRPRSPVTRRVRPSSPRGDGSRPRPHGASPVTAGGSWSSRTTRATWSASGAPPARSRAGCFDNSDAETEDVASRAVRPPGGSTPTT